MVVLVTIYIIAIICSSFGMLATWAPIGSDGKEAEV